MMYFVNPRGEYIFAEWSADHDSLLFTWYDAKDELVGQNLLGISREEFDERFKGYRRVF